ncbi:S41 family peptidase [Luteimonas terrae]|uniref:Carboxyl-terminal processing protease n=1 Tax=Luteimonas terrae TaxID=1530191 RepID=A0ABU1Y0E9_9GAMM|nr:S41 family peptidase [Luteimonas terrae]MDR7193925.1 carboxyl-terminal processing protease [Luteimonas terrae]
MRVSSLTLALSLLLSPAAFAQTPPPVEAPAEIPSDASEPTPPANAPTDPPSAADDAEIPVAASDDPGAMEQASNRVPLQEIRRYVGVFNAVREAYVEPVEDRKLMSSAIRGLLLDLDPHSVYMEKDTATAFDEGTEGAYDGIGVEVMYLGDGSMRVIAPIDGTPAEKAGIRAGDVIVSVDGRTLTPSDNNGAGPLRGAPGTSVMLGVLRDGETAPLEIRVDRETIRVVSVRGRMLEPGYGYIRLSQFQMDTAADFSRIVGELKQQAGGSLRGLVIDLRSNPGGLLTSAVQIADDLLDSGKIVSTRGRIPISDAEFSATPGDLLDGAPVIALVDVGSASASEVLAGALRDNNRARVIGSRTFGKGSVQTVLPLDNGDSVKLTTARYYTPSGRSIQARGIDPDTTLRPEGAESADPNAPRAATVYTEANLPGHLQGDEEDGSTGGEALPGDGPINAALAELKKPWVPTAQVHAEDAPPAVAPAQATEAAPATAPAPATQPAPSTEPAPETEPTVDPAPEAEPASPPDTSTDPDAPATEPAAAPEAVEPPSPTR